MSTGNVGSDAAYMLEKALEEMDDIFRESCDGTIDFNTDPITPTSNISTNNHIKFNEHVEKFKGILNELEHYLQWQIAENQQFFHYEKEAVLSYCKSLVQVPLFFQDIRENQLESTGIFLQDKSDEKLNRLQKERDTFDLEVKLLKEEKNNLEELLNKTKKELGDYAKKNEELLIRITEQRVAEQQTHKSSHNELLLDEDEDGHEMDRLKNHIDTLLVEQEKKKAQGCNGEDSLAGLKTRLRDKASECNRLKLQLEDTKQMHDAKDVTIRTIQDQIQRLFEENEILRKQLASATTVNNNLHATLFTKCTGGPPSESASSSGGVSKYKPDYSQIKGLKCASEPNLIQNGLRAPVSGLLSPSSVHEDDAVYRPYRRMISESPFATWTLDQVQDWLREEGLEEYVDACSRCVTKGEDLLKFTNADYERDLGIQDPIVRKKLNLALQAQTSSGCDYAGRLDNAWVIHWLEDLGLPQYKQAFYEHKIDGRVLVNMTLDDVLQAKVYNLLHHTSLKRAIQFLRHQRFHPQFLREIANQSEERCDHVMLWTNHRIMHWLRSVDLAEYAPNLRGSGVHGALMVLEPRFNADTLANLLSIPNNKTLLRRHVATQFATLLGDACQKQKDITMKTSDFTPLNGSEKHKLRKKGFGSLRRRKSEVDLTELLCPSELDVSNLYSPPPALDPEVIFDPPDTSSLSPSIIADNVSESTNDTSSVPKITGLSQEIDHMTSMLENETPS